MSRGDEASGTGARAYFNEAERLDPRNVYLITQHAQSYQCLRRFPEALRKLDQILNITPDDVDTLVFKAAIAQAEGDLSRASAFLAALHPAANDTNALETQVYQVILERRPAPIIPRLKEILAKPDPALGYFNGELRFLFRLGPRSRGRPCRGSGKLATGTQRTGTFPQRTARELGPDWRSRVDQCGPRRQSRRVGIVGQRSHGRESASRKTRYLVPLRWRSSLGWRHRWESPTAPSPLYRSYSRYHTVALSLRAHSLLRCSGSIRCSIRSETIRASKNSASWNHQNTSVNFSDKFGHRNCAILRDSAIHRFHRP